MPQKRLKTKSDSRDQRYKHTGMIRRKSVTANCVRCCIGVGGWDYVRSGSETATDKLA